MLLLLMSQFFDFWILKRFFLSSLFFTCLASHTLPPGFSFVLLVDVYCSVSELIMLNKNMEVFSYLTNSTFICPISPLLFFSHFPLIVFTALCLSYTKTDRLTHTHTHTPPIAPSVIITQSSINFAASGFPSPSDCSCLSS